MAVFRPSETFQFSISPAISVTWRTKQNCNEETTRNFLKMFTLTTKSAAEFSAIAELSAKQQSYPGPVSICADPRRMQRDEAKPGKCGWKRRRKRPSKP